MNGNNGNGKSRHYSTFVLLLLASIAVMVMYVEAMAFPSLPKVMVDFGLTPSDYALASWVVTIYLVVGAVAIPVFGKLGDIYGKKKMLVITMVIYSTMVTLTGFSRDLSDSIYVMILFRAFQGIAFCMFPLAFSIIRDEFPRDRIAIAQGVISAMFGVGTAVGFVVGGYVTDRFGWAWTYHTVAPFAVLATVVVALKVRESPVRMKAKVDFVGAALLGAAMVSFLVGVTETENRGWEDPLVVSLLILAVCFLAGVVYWLPRAKDPLIRPKLLKERDIALTNIIGFIIGFGLFTSNQTIAALAGFNFGLDATDIGLLMLPMSIVTLVLGPTVGLIVRKYGPKYPMAFGMSLAILGFVTLYFFHDTRLDVMIGVSIMGAGGGFSMVSSINMVILSTPIQETGVSTAMNMIVRTSGSVVGPALAAVIISMNSHPGVIPGTEIPDDYAYQVIFIMSAAVMALGVVFSAFLTNKKALPERGKSDAASTVAQACDPE